MTTFEGGMAWAAASSVTLPLFAAAGAFLRGGRAAGWLAVAATAACLAAALALGAGLWVGGAGRLAVAGWAAPLGIAWRVDAMAVIFMTAAAGVTLGAAVYARPDSWQRGGKPVLDRFPPQAMFLLAALNALFLSNDAFNLYVTLELSTLAAVAMVALHGEGPVLVAAVRYLLVAMFASLSYLLGVGLLYGAFGVLDLTMLADRVRPGLPVSAALALMTAGLMAKGAFFPLHGWLPPAHGSAPAPASALLSGLVVKAAFYVLLRLWLEVFAKAGLGQALPQLVGALGAAAVVWGSVLALRQARLKLLLAYSTVAQLGYLLIAIPLSLAAPGAAVGGAVHLAASHAFAKAAMFLAAGSIILSLGHDRLEEMQGTARCHPMTAFTLALGGLTLIGLPPSGGFIAKWLLLEASLRSGQWWWIIPILGGSLLAAAYVFLVLSRAIALRDREDPPFRKVPARLEVAGLLLALSSILLGMAGALPLFLLDRASGAAAWEAG